MVFGMGCCCLQETIQTSSLDDARRLYDQLSVFAPFAMALTASSPIFRGVLVDVDCRWDVISTSVDDRTEEEMDPLNPMSIPKSRYSSISHYIHQDGYHHSRPCAAWTL